jgi:hypothetical protein
MIISEVFIGGYGCFVFSTGTLFSIARNDGAYV